MHVRALLTKAAQFLQLSNEEKVLFLGAICVAGKAKSDAKFICMFPTNLLLQKTMIGWSKCEQS